MKSLLKIVLTVLILTGCMEGEKSEVKCLPPSTSSLKYSYSGFINGEYSVQGEVPSSITSNIHDFNWATGSKFIEFGINYIMINSNLVYTGKNSTVASLIVQMILPDKGVGKYALQNDRLNVLNLEYSPSWSGELVFEFISGQVDITYYQCNRIKGTFSGKLSAVNDGEIVTINVTGGEFDVKLKTN